MITKRLKANIEANAIIDIDLALKKQVDKNTQDIVQTNVKVQDNAANIQINTTDIGSIKVDLADKVSTPVFNALQQSVDTNKTKIAENLNLINTKADRAEVVLLNGSQTINDIKTFTSVVKGITPIADEDFATKKYVDDNSGGGGVVPPDLVQKVNQNIQDIANLKQEDTTINQELQNIDGLVAVNGAEINKNKQSITANTGEITNIKQQAATMNTTIQQNTAKANANEAAINALKPLVNANTQEINTVKPKVDKNKQLIDEVINDLKTSTIINYKGVWTNQTAKLGEVWSYQDKMYICKVASSNKAPTTKSDWDLISTQDINLSGYYTSTQVDGLLTGYAQTSVTDSINRQVATNTQSIQNNATAITTKANQTEIVRIDGVLANKADSSALATKADTTALNALQQTVNTKWGQSEVVAQINRQAVLLSGDQTIEGVKKFRGIPEFGTRIKMGHGAAECRLTPEDNSEKALKFGGQANNRSSRFDLDLENQSIIKNCREITASGELKLRSGHYVSLENQKIVRLANGDSPDHAVNKGYVDAEVAKRTPYGAVPNQAAAHITGEVKMGYTFAGKQVYSAMVGVGDITSSNQVPADGQIKNIGAGNFFLGVGYGVIRRSNGQVHNINAVTNAPDEHASIIYQDGTNIKWWFNPSMTLSGFHRRAFVCQIFYTKNA